MTRSVPRVAVVVVVVDLQTRVLVHRHHDLHLFRHVQYLGHRLDLLIPYHQGLGELGNHGSVVDHRPRCCATEEVLDG